jgi:hypothetical protein
VAFEKNGPTISGEIRRLVALSDSSDGNKSEKAFRVPTSNYGKSSTLLFPRELFTMAFNIVSPEAY